jgi:hypothetical protein
VALPHPAVRYPKPVAATGFSSVEDQFEQVQTTQSTQSTDQTPAPLDDTPAGPAHDNHAEHQPSETQSPEGAILLPE